MAMPPESVEAVPVSAECQSPGPSDGGSPPALLGALSSDPRKSSSANERGGASTSTSTLASTPEWPSKPVRKNGLGESKPAAEGVAQKAPSDRPPASASALAATATTPRTPSRTAPPNAASISNHNYSSSSSSSTTSSGGSSSSFGSRVERVSRLAAAAAREVLVPPTPPPARGWTPEGKAGDGVTNDPGLRRGGSGSSRVPPGWATSPAPKASNGGDRIGAKGHRPDGTSLAPRDTGVGEEKGGKDGGGGGGSGGGGPHRRERGPSPSSASLEDLPVDFVERPTSARVAVGSYSIGDGEEWWPQGGGGGSGGGDGGDGGGGDGGGRNTVDGAEEAAAQARPPPSPSGLESGDGGAQEGAAGREGGGDDADGALSPPRNGDGRSGARGLVLDRSTGAGVGAGAGAGGGANGEGEGGVDAVMPVQQQQNPRPPIGPGRPLGEVPLSRSTTDLENMHPPTMLRQTSKYLHEDLALAKRRQNLRARAKRRKRISFADEHGDALYDTDYHQDLYYSKEGVPTPRKSGSCCIIS